MEILVEGQIGRGLTNGIGCDLAGLQRLIVQNRLDQNQRTQVGGLERLVAGELSPGKGAAAGHENLLKTFGHKIKGPRQRLARQFPPLHALQRCLEHPGQAADAGIVMQNVEKRLRRRILAGDLADLGRWQEQKAVILEKRGISRTDHRGEFVGLGDELLLQRIARLGRQFGRCRLDNRDDQIISARKSLLVGQLTLPPRQVFGNQFVNVS